MRVTVILGFLFSAVDFRSVVVATCSVAGVMWSVADFRSVADPVTGFRSVAGPVADFRSVAGPVTDFRYVAGRLYTIPRLVVPLRYFMILLIHVQSFLDGLLTC